MNRPTLRTAFLFAASLCLLLAITIPLVRTASRDTPVIVINVPNGFRGIFTITADAGGKPPIVGNNSATYAIPDDGMCLTSTISPLRQWHKIHGRYADGTKLQTLASSDPSSVLLYELGSGSGEVFFLVGTKAEYDQFNKDRKRWFRFDVPVP